MYDVVVIGAGPAGLSAAIYALRAGKKVLVLEGKSYGGQIINTPKVENYPGIKEISGFGFATDMFEQAKALGAEIHYEKCTGIEKKAVTQDNEVAEIPEIGGKEPEQQVAEVRELDVDEGEAKGQFTVSTQKNSFTCESVILAAGAVNRKLGVEGETELIGKGVSYCATCDGAFFRGKDVAVVGGGNTALEDALFLSNYCKSVSIIHRRDTFRGEKKRELLLREKENVHFYMEQKVVSIHGVEHLEKLTLQHTVNGEETILPVEGLFVAVGQIPDTQDFRTFLNVDGGGYVEAGEDCHTNIPGIFVAGDCRTKQVRQLTTAVADGSVAALAACAYCEEKI